MLFCIIISVMFTMKEKMNSLQNYNSRKSSVQFINMMVLVLLCMIHLSYAIHHKENYLIAFSKYYIIISIIG